MVNHAHVRTKALLLVEFAEMVQSEQLQAAWGTPCVQFGPKGWPLTLKPGGPTHNADGSTSFVTSGYHCGPDGSPIAHTCYSSTPSITVVTAEQSYRVWARAFTHEVAEALADPTDDVRWSKGLLEICDPVQLLTYPIFGVQVSNFVFPSYFSDGSPPYDEMRALSSPAP